MSWRRSYVPCAVLLALGSQRQVDAGFEVIFGYIVSARPARPLGDPVSSTKGNPKVIQPIRAVGRMLTKTW